MTKAAKVLIALLLIFSFVCGDFYTLKAQAKTSQTAVVNAYSLHIRNKASLKGKIIGYVKKGKKVQVLKTEKKWTYIKYGSTKGWVSAKYLSMPKNSG
ncbi:SH3 domain-containing protein [Terrilactibacillus sp. S3-3]|nr:SH3 domain-containing protein [Terrilactibacillus sp. S3-3]